MFFSNRSIYMKPELWERIRKFAGSFLEYMSISKVIRLILEVFLESEDFQSEVLQKLNEEKKF